MRGCEPQTNVCIPCPPPQPCVPRKKLLDIKREHMKATPECSRANCVLAGHFDIPYYGEPYKMKQKKLPGSLGFPVGLVYSKNYVISSPRTNRILMERFAITLKAFSKLYALDELKWTSDTIEFILREGGTLFLDSMENENLASFEGGELNISNEQKIRREFDAENTVFGVELEPKFQGLDRSGKPEFYITDDEEGKILDPTAGNKPLVDFKSIAQQYFKLYNFAFVHFSEWFVLIWKAHGVYFVLDLFGRRLNDLYSDHEGNGRVTFIALKSLCNVDYLITTLSDLPSNETFSIQEMKMVRVTRPNGLTAIRAFGKRTNDFIILRNDYAILRSKLHASLDRAKTFKNRIALPIGIAAILASKVDHPATWSTSDLDKIICYGANMCRECFQSCMDSTNPINLSTLPNNIRLGQFWMEYKLYTSHFSGIWKCVPYQQQGQLYGALKQAFEEGANSILIQISFQIYAIMKKKAFYYLLDPYLHKIRGMSEDEDLDPKSATLRMFCDFDTMMEVFHDLLLQNTRSGRFFLHIIKVRTIRDAELDAPAARIGENDDCANKDIEKDVDVESLNEYICFDIDERKCWDEFGQESDFEEEEEEIPWSEYEEEQMPGEEEEAGPEPGPPLEIFDEGGDDDEGAAGGATGAGAKGAGAKGGRTKGGGARGGGGKGGGAKGGGGKGGRGKGGGAEDDEMKVDTEKGGGAKKNKRKSEHVLGGGAGEKGPKVGGADAGGKNKDEVKARDEKQNLKVGKGNKEAEVVEKNLDVKGGTANKQAGMGEKTQDVKGGTANKQAGMAEKTQDVKGGTGNKQGEKNQDVKGGVGNKEAAGTDGKGGKGPKGNEKEDVKGGIGNKEAAMGEKSQGLKLGVSNKQAGIGDKKHDGKGTKGTSGSTGDKTQDSKGAATSAKNQRDIALKRELQAAAQKLTADKLSGSFADRLKEHNAALESAVQKLQQKVCKKVEKKKCYPTYKQTPHDLCIIGSESGTYDDICRNVRTALECSDRLLLIVPWGNYVIFETVYDIDKKLYYLFSGCTCDINRFRYIDLSCGTEGLLPFRSLDDMVTFIIDSSKIRDAISTAREGLFEDVCCQ